MRHDRPIEKRAGSCELTEKQSTGGRNTLSKRPTKRPPLATVLYYISELCRCRHSLENNCLYRENGKYAITITWNPSLPSTNHWSMKKIQNKNKNKIKHHGCCGTVISSVSTVLNTHPTAASAGGKFRTSTSLCTPTACRGQLTAVGTLRPQKTFADWWWHEEILMGVFFPCIIPIVTDINYVQRKFH